MAPSIANRSIMHILDSEITNNLRYQGLHRILVYIISICIIITVFNGQYTMPAKADSVILQPGSEGKDSYVASYGSDSNYGDVSYLREGNQNDFYMLTYIEFDISSIPHGSQIDSAYLRLYCMEAGADQFRVNTYLALDSWEEDEITWSNQPDGDYPEGVIFAGDGWHQWDVKNKVRKWVKGDRENYGFVIGNPNAEDGEWCNYESGDSDNSDNRPKLTVEYTPPEESKPDLKIGSITFNPEDPEANEDTDITIRVDNIGENDASDQFDLELRINDVYIESWSISSLSEGSSITRTFNNHQFEAGEHEIEANVDVDDNVDESVESNNDHEEELTVYDNSKPDLIVDFIRTDPEEPVENEETDVMIRVRNDGDADVNEDFEIRYYIDDEEIDKRTCSGLSTSSYFDWTLSNWKFDDGTHEIEAITDWYNDIPELNEDNNDKILEIEVEEAPKPDLIVVDIWTTPSNPKDDEKTTIHFTIKNQGNEDVDRSFATKLYINDEFYKRVTDDGLLEGASRQHNIEDVLLNSGTQELRVLTDSSSSVIESDNNNNERIEQVSVSSNPKPDIIVDSIWSDPSNPKVDEETDFYVRIKNVGDADADGRFICRLKIDGEYVSYIEKTNLLQGQTYDWVIHDLSFDEGRYDVQAIVDTDNDIIEKDENNNDDSIELLVSDESKPDIIVVDMWTDPLTIIDEEKFTIHFRIKNQGNKDIDLSFVIKVYIDDDEFGRVTCSGMAIDQTIHYVSSETSFVHGNYEATIETDINNNIDELDESNNDFHQSITINEVDGAVEFINISPNVFVYDSGSNPIKVEFENNGLRGNFKLHLRVVSPNIINYEKDNIIDGEEIALDRYENTLYYIRDIDLNSDGYYSYTFNHVFQESGNSIFLFANILKGETIIESYFEHVFITEDGQLLVYELDYDNWLNCKFTKIDDLSSRQMILWKGVMFPFGSKVNNIEIPILVTLDSYFARKAFEDEYVKETVVERGYEMVRDFFIGNLYLGAKTLWEDYVVGKYDDYPEMEYVLRQDFVLVGYDGASYFERDYFQPWKLIGLETESEISELVNFANNNNLEIVFCNELNIFTDMFGNSDKPHKSTFITLVELDYFDNNNDGVIRTYNVYSTIEDWLGDIKRSHDIAYWTGVVLEIIDIALIAYGAVKCLTKLAKITTSALKFSDNVAIHMGKSFPKMNKFRWGIDGVGAHFDDITRMKAIKKLRKIGENVHPDDVKDFEKFIDPLFNTNRGNSYGKLGEIDELAKHIKNGWSFRILKSHDEGKHGTEFLLKNSDGIVKKIQIKTLEISEFKRSHIINHLNDALKNKNFLTGGEAKEIVINGKYSRYIDGMADDAEIQKIIFDWFNNPKYWDDGAKYIDNVVIRMKNSQGTPINSVLANPLKTLTYAALKCPADLLITNYQGKSIGFSNGVFINEIPDAYYEYNNDTEYYFLPENEKYSFTVFGTGNGFYDFEIMKTIGNEKMEWTYYVPLTSDTIDKYLLIGDTIIFDSSLEEKEYSVTIIDVLENETVQAVTRQTGDSTADAALPQTTSGGSASVVQIDSDEESTDDSSGFGIVTIIFSIIITVPIFANIRLRIRSNRR